MAGAESLAGLNTLHSGGLGLTELGKKVSDCIGHQVFTYKKREQINTYSMKLLEIVESFV